MSNLHVVMSEMDIEPTNENLEKRYDEIKAIVNTHESIMEVINQGLKNI